MRLTARLSAVVGLLVAATLRASSPTMPVSEIRLGQTGYGLSDFGGGRGIERFDVEILGVLKDFAPKQDLILARLSGCGLENSGIIAGMSGSPVYIDDRLIGAVAFGWPFSREPIAGITPIESMLDIRHLPPSVPVPISQSAPSAVSSKGLLSALNSRVSAVDSFRQLLERVFPPAREALGWSPLPLPLTLPAGLSAESLFSPLARSGAWVAAGTAAAQDSGPDSLSPGSGISTVLVSGDMTLAASGTVTWVDGENVLAFGHPFLSMGPVEMPMAGSDVIGVLPSLYRSFKFVSAGKVLGSITQDRSTGILGSFGRKATMVPVTVSIASEKVPVQKYRFEVVRNSMLTPILSAMAIDSTLTTLEKSAGERTLVWKSSIATPERTIHYQSVYSGLAAREQAVASMALLTNYLMANEFRDLTIDGIDVAIVHSDDVKSARLTSVEPDKERVRPGETVGIRVELQDFRGESRQVKMSLPIPPETPSGPLTVFVGDGVAATAYDLSLFPPDPRSLDQVINFLERLRPANTVNLLAYRTASGAVVGGEELAALPPSVATLFGAPGVSDGTPSLAYERVFSQTVEQPIPVAGSVRLTLSVIDRTD
jgi:hypothetical protein